MTRRTTQQLVDMKVTGDPIAMVTAYDATFARLLEEAGADVLLVGDSLGLGVQGHDSTLPVTMDQMVYHTAAVVRGSQRAMVVADLPFMSYQASVADAVRNGGRLLAETGCQAVKLEGGTRSAPAVEAMVEAGIPVMGHLGLTPQSVNVFGGFKVQGREEGAAERLIAEATAADRVAMEPIARGVPRPSNPDSTRLMKMTARRDLFVPGCFRFQCSVRVENQRGTRL